MNDPLLGFVAYIAIIVLAACSIFFVAAIIKFLAASLAHLGGF